MLRMFLRRVRGPATVDTGIGVQEQQLKNFAAESRHSIDDDRLRKIGHFRRFFSARSFDELDSVRL
jgi:hypothetical protein